MTDLFGQPLSLASPSPPPDRDEASMTNGTCGLSSTISCAPAGPDSFLVSRSPLPQSSALQARLESAVRRRTAPLGSTLFSLTWKPHVTPAGRSLFRLRASAPRTTGCGSTGSLRTWATPVTEQANGTPEMFLERKRRSMARGSQSMGVCLSDLNMRAQAFAAWPTAKASDGSGGRTTETAGGGNAHLDREVRLAGWPTGRRAGPVNGVWRDADWLFCTDGKWRPVEPGTQPLASGVPGRVGKLRAYGNAICVEQAKVFIEAVREIVESI